MAHTVTIRSNPRDRQELRVVGPSAVVAALSEIASALRGTRTADQLADLIARRLRAAGNEAEREARVLEALLPPVDTLTDAATTQLRWNAVARASALRELGAYSSQQLADLRGSKTANPHATTSRWISRGRVFAVDSASGRLFPAFQFRDGEPRPVIRAVLSALASQLQGWSLLLWFTGSNGSLDGARPVDLLERGPDRVVAAAAYQASLSQD